MDRITANLPSRDFDATVAFYVPLGFDIAFRDDHWMILQHGGMTVEFFVHDTLDPASSWFSACLRVDDLDAYYKRFQQAGLSANPRDIPRLTPPEQITPDIRMFAFVDNDGSLWRCLENEIA